MSLSFFPFQVILIIFLLFAFSRVFLRFREGSVGSGAFLFWSGIWLLALVGVIEPGFTTYFANRLGIGRGVDVIIYLSVLLLFYLMYRTNVHLENLRHEITKLTRKIALDRETGSGPKREKRQSR
jgi:hypothetical protein